MVILLVYIFCRLGSPMSLPNTDVKKYTIFSASSGRKIRQKFNKLKTKCEQPTKTPMLFLKSLYRPRWPLFWFTTSLLRKNHVSFPNPGRVRASKESLINYIIFLF